MKTFILPALCALTLAAGSLQAQNFNRTAASAGEIFPLENTLVMAEGDMNKDGVMPLDLQKKPSEMSQRAFS